MKKSILWNYTWFRLVVLMLLSACQSESPNVTLQTAQIEISDESTNIKIEKGFAIVELFTSEGCSSCPPADAVAGEIARKADQGGQHIYVLPYHVDYWNYLGWKDRFSDKIYTKRQYWYADRFKSTRVYTPQMIINGKSEFTGSRKSMANEEIQKALQKTAQSSVGLDLKEDLTYTIQAKSVAESWALHYAIVQKELSSQVNAGENRGRRLFHYSVVRTLNSIDKPQVKGELKFNKDKKEGKYAVIAFIQDTKTAEIIAADQVLFND